MRIHMMNHRLGKPPAGFTLIELLVVLTVGTALIAMAATTLNGLLKLEQAHRRRMVVATSWDRLAEQFRGDVHAAEAAAEPATDEVVAGPDERWRIGPKRRVRYHREEDVLVRTVTEDGRAVAGESFPLPPGITASITVGPLEGGPNAATLLLEPDPSEPRRLPLGTFRVVAEWGRDHRFAAGKPDEEPEP